MTELDLHMTVFVFFPEKKEFFLTMFRFVVTKAGFV